MIPAARSSFPAQRIGPILCVLIRTERNPLEPAQTLGEPVGLGVETAQAVVGRSSGLETGADVRLGQGRALDRQGDRGAGPLG